MANLNKKFEFELNPITIVVEPKLGSKPRDIASRRWFRTEDTKNIV